MARNGHWYQGISFGSAQVCLSRLHPAGSLTSLRKNHTTALPLRVIRVTPEGTEPVVVREGKAVAMGFEHKSPADDSVKESSPAPELMPVDA